jgi:hypothetical protein
MNVDDKLSIAGYAYPLSVKAGEAVDFHISSNASCYSIEISRIGFDRRVVWNRKGLKGEQHAIPENAFSHGCRWPVALELKVPEDWLSGYYHVQLQGEDRNGQTARGQLFFVVRSAHPGRDSSILLQLTTNTANAYNTWGGASLYRGTHGPSTRVSFERPYAGMSEQDGLFLFSMDAACVPELDHGVASEEFRSEFQKQVEAYSVPSIDLSASAMISSLHLQDQWLLCDHVGLGPAAYHVRREADRLDVREAITWWESGWRNWEMPFVAWAEGEGYRLDYALNADLEFHPEILEHYHLVLSVGHDEYWSAPMRDHLEAYIANDGNVAFFSGNTAWWQVRSEDEGRAIVCYRDPGKDPFYAGGDHRLLTTVWCHRLIGRPENQLTGVSFAYGGYARFFDQFVESPGAYTVHKPDHWMFEGTGLQRGDLLGESDRIVQYECDGCDFELNDGLPVATGLDGTPSSFEILATAPAGLTDFDGSNDQIADALYNNHAGSVHPYPGSAVLGSYTSGGTVVTTGCTHWAYGLRGNDKTVERITRNILDRLSKP